MVEIFYTYLTSKDNKRKMQSNACKKMLCDFLGKEPEIEKDKNGKPYLLNSDIKFNFSHSEDMSIVAVSSFEVGIDAEKIRPVDLKLSKRCFTQNEQEIINNSLDKEKEFLKLWVKKESYLKYLATGIMHLKSTDVTTAKDVNFFEMQIDDYLICLCTNEKEYTVIKKEL